MFKRAVKHYVRKSHNCKGIENTLPKCEARREFLKSIVQPKKSTAERSYISQGKGNLPMVRLELATPGLKTQCSIQLAIQLKLLLGRS